MNKRTYSDDLLIRYLLGDLSEEERIRLEEEFFTDDELFEEMVALEEELMYDYAQGRLTGRERELFERRFLVTKADREKLEVVGAISSRLAARARAKRAGRQAGLWRKLVAFFQVQNPALQLGFAVATLVALIGCVWLATETIRLRDQIGEIEAAKEAQARDLGERMEDQQAKAQELTSQLEGERSERERLARDLAREKSRSQEQILPAIISFVLTPGSVRGGGEIKRLAIPPVARALRLQLNIRKKADYRSYRATLLSAEGEEVWSQDRLPHAGQSVYLRLPAAALKEGDYELTLQGMTAGRDFEEVATYYFSVVRK
ncbi:MAG: hypothetical protein AB1631_21280 [Acidobacteriota bacterium]